MKPQTMNAKAPDRRVWHLVSFILPIFVLLGIAGFGLWRERAAATLDQQRQLGWDAATAAKLATPIIEREMEAWAWAEANVTDGGQVFGKAWFGETPMPQAETDSYQIFKAGRYGEVIDRFPGELSPGGIPLGPLAAFQRLKKAQDDGVALEAARNVRELSIAFPSALSSELLEEVTKELAKRGLTDTGAETWKDRWSRLERVARAFDQLTERRLPQVGRNVVQLDSELWWVDVWPDGNARKVRVFPFGDAVRKIRAEWEKIPLSNGGHLALVASNLELIPRPDGVMHWPQSEVFLLESKLKVLALGDPAAAERGMRLRVLVLGSVGLLAAAMVWMAWWRQRNAMNMQHELVRQKDDFLSTVSHELRTPAASMRLLAENLVSGDVTSPEAARTYYRQLLREARRLSSTTEHLLDFSLMERGHMAFHFETIDPVELADEIRAVLVPQAGANHIGLVVLAAPIDPPPIGDVEGIRRIILNLADNAIKFSAPQGQVQIQIEPAAPGHWSIVVRDQGPGIAEEEQKRIFERFFRGGSILDRKTRGTGIGLAVARHIAEGHGGTLVLSSSSASGSVFACTLPIRPKPGSEPL